MTEEPATVIPQRLRDMNPDTILMFDRMDSKEREAFIWCVNLSPEERARLDKLLQLDAEKFQAGFKLVELWIRVSWVLGRLGWLGKTSVWIITATAGILVALTQIIEHLSKVRP